MYNIVRKGYSIIELLISLILLSLLAMTISLVYREINLLLQRSLLVLPTEQMYITKIYYSILSQFPYVIREKGQYHFFFQGERNKLKFVTSYDFKSNKHSDTLFLTTIQSNNGTTISQTPIFKNKLVDPISLNKTAKPSLKKQFPFTVTFAFIQDKKKVTSIKHQIPEIVILKISLKSKEIYIKAKIPSSDNSKIKLTKFLDTSTLE